MLKFNCFTIAKLTKVTKKFLNKLSWTNFFFGQTIRLLSGLWKTLKSDVQKDIKGRACLFVEVKSTQMKLKCFIPRGNILHFVGARQQRPHWEFSTKKLQCWKSYILLKLKIGFSCFFPLRYVSICIRWHLLINIEQKLSCKIHLSTVISLAYKCPNFLSSNLATVHILSDFLA